MRINKVKRAVGEGHVLSIALDEPTFQIGQLKAPPRDAHGRVRQVECGVMSTGASEAFGLAAASATDFEHPQAAGFFKADRRL
jgi:hypothetical protein